MNRVAAWLCEANKGDADANGVLKGEGYSDVTKRALKWRTGYGNPEDPNWVCVYFFVFLFESSYVFHDGDDGLITDDDDADTGAFEFVVFEYEEDARS